jgi:hypothetical protein
MRLVITWLFDDKILGTMEPEFLPRVGDKVKFTTLAEPGGPHESIPYLQVQSVEHELYLNPDKKASFCQKIDTQQVTIRLKRITKPRGEL